MFSEHPCTEPHLDILSGTGQQLHQTHQLSSSISYLIWSTFGSRLLGFCHPDSKGCVNVEVTKVVSPPLALYTPWLNGRGHDAALQWPAKLAVLGGREGKDEVCTFFLPLVCFFLSFFNVAFYWIPPFIATPFSSSFRSLLLFLGRFYIISFFPLASLPETSNLLLVLFLFPDKSSYVLPTHLSELRIYLSFVVFSVRKSWREWDLSG